MKLKGIGVLSCLLMLVACTQANAPRSTASTPSATIIPVDISPTSVGVTSTPASPATPKPTATVRATSAVTPTEAASSDPRAALKLELFVSGLERPTYLADANDATPRLFIVEQPGAIRIVENGQLRERPFLDITDRVLANGSEQGLLSVAFHPAYPTNGQFFVNYTRRPDGATQIERYTVSLDEPNVADKNSASIVLVIEQPEANHNGGLVLFGPDGYLYIGMGDGGGAGDRHGTIGNGQDLNVLLGKLLRIDVTNQAAYAIPPDNPFGNEIWSYGWRNPWRFAFDRATHDLYVADVGQNQYEEIHFQPASSQGGENYGWRIMEGRHCFSPKAGCDQSGLVLPIAEYSHAAGCSVTGGYVYRGKQYPPLTGQYFFADYCTSTVWSVQRDASDHWQLTERLNSDLRISSFGEDRNGELYVLDHGGGVYRLTAAP